MQEKIKNFFKDDRYWRPEHRIAHAKYQLKIARGTKDEAFWQAVLEAFKD